VTLPELRKLVTYDEEIHRDGDRAADPALRLIAVAAVVRNPWAGRGYVEDLGPEIARMAPVLGRLLTDRLVALAGSGEAIEAYGKAAMGGTEAEMEHVSALIHTLRFGNFYREAVAARTYLGFTTARGAAGGQIQIPLMDKHAGAGVAFPHCAVPRPRRASARRTGCGAWRFDRRAAASPDRRPLCRSGRDGA